MRKLKASLFFTILFVFIFLNHSYAQQTDRFRGVVGNVAVKVPCKVATTENITLSGAQTIDGVALTADESPRQRVLVKDQTDATENGIYDVNSGAWTRSPDFDGARDVVSGTVVLVNEGDTLNAPFQYYVSTSDPITIGTSEINFAIKPYWVVREDSTAYEPDYSATDQGVTGDNNTIKYYRDAIGDTDKATLFLRHDSGVSQTTYTVTSGITIPSNQVFVMEEGAILDGVGTITFAGGPSQIKARDDQQIFGASITVSWGKAGTFYPGWWDIAGDGSMDDDAAFVVMLASIPSGSGLELLSGATYLVHGDLSYSNKIHVYGNGTLKTKAGENYDNVISFSGDESIIENIKIDQSLTTSNTGNNHGLEVSGDKWIVKNCFVVGTGTNCTAGNTYHLTGDGFISGCDSKNAKYAGFRFNGDGTDGQIIAGNLRAYDYNNKGIVYNPNSGNCDSFIVSAVLLESTTGNALDGLLVDMGAYDINEIIISDVVIRGTHTSNTMKIVDDGSSGSVEHCILNNLILSGTTADNSLALNFDGDVYVKIVYNEAQVEFRNRLDSVVAQGFECNHTTAAEATSVLCRASGTMSLSDFSIKGFTGYALDYEEISTSTYLLLDKIEIEGAASDDNLLSIDSTYGITPGHLQLGLIIVTTGDTTETNGYTGATANERLLQRNIGQRPRIFRYTASPTWVAWAGDICYDLTPTSGNPMGWAQEDRYDTTINGVEASGQTTITVTDATGIADNDIVGIRLDSGGWHWSDVNGAPVGNDIVVSDALPSAADDGNEFIAGTWLPLASLP